MLPKPVRKEKVKRPMNRIGPVGRRRLAENAARKPLAESLPYCEVGPILKARGITHVRCGGDSTWAHSVKCSKRGRDPILEAEVVRSCERHHFFYLDELAPELTAEIVRYAISIRGKY